MKILYFTTSYAHNVQGTKRSIKEELERLGHKVISHDAGKSWQPANDTNMADQNVVTLAIHPQDPEIVYAGTANNGVYKTTNEGKTWQVINEGLSVTAVHALAIDPGNPEIPYLIW